MDERQPNSKISVADWLEEAKSSTTIVDLEKKGFKFTKPAAAGGLKLVSGFWQRLLTS